MEIRELAIMTGIPLKTIRYHELIGVLPSPKRKPNSCRNYDKPDIERVKFVSGARSLGFPLDAIAEILALHDRCEAPCRVVLDLLEQRVEESGVQLGDHSKVLVD